MAEGITVLSDKMRESLFLGDNGTDSVDTESQGSRDEIVERDPGFVEDRFRVDRKKLEQMLQLVPPNDDSDEAAEDFFQRIMEETSTQITWPSKLKIGAKSKKDPHIKVMGYPENVRAAKAKILPVLDTKSNRVTLKMDVSHTEHSHVIGKGGNNIKRVMTDTGCHIHFPDSNRGSNLQEKSNQVSIAGQPDGVEIARAQIRDLLPLVFMFELPVTSPLTPTPDVSSPLIQQLQQTHGVTVIMKQRARTYGTSVQVRGSVHSAKEVKQATGFLMEHLAGNSALPVSTQLEIAPQHHLFIIGRGAGNLHHIMQQTGAHILFPDPSTTTPQRRGTVYISGAIENVFLARQYLMGCLPLVLMFDVKETIELDQGKITQLMETLDVFISVKPKPKQPSKSVIVKSIERNARNMYLAREILVGLRSEASIAALLNNNIINTNNHCSIINNSTVNGSTGLSLAGLNLLTPRLVSVPSDRILINGHHAHPAGTAALASPAATTTIISNGNNNTVSNIINTSNNNVAAAAAVAAGAQVVSVAGGHWLAPATGVYSPLMVVTPASTTLPHLSPGSATLTPVTPAANLTSLELVSPQGQATLSAALTSAPATNGFHHDLASSAFIRVPTPLDPTGRSSTTSDSASPPHSPSNSPSPVALCSTAAELASLQKAGTLGEVLSQEAKASLIAAALHQHHQKQQQQLLSSGVATATNNHHHHQHLHSPSTTAALLAHHHHHHHHHLQQQHHTSQLPLDLLGLSKTTSLTQISSLAHSPASPTSLTQISSLAHGPASPTALFAGISHDHLVNGDSSIDPSMADGGPSEKLAPGIERKNSTTSLFASPLQFAFDYEQKKLLAMKAMQKKPEGESRTPTDIWAGMGFSKSMPESAIRDKLGQMGISARITDTALDSGYEPNRPEIDLSIDQDLWAEDGRPERGMSGAVPAGMTSVVGSGVTRPLNKAPGEYPSPRKKAVQYGLSHSNHVDSASLPPNKSVWSTKTGLAELFSALGLSKYTDLFTQQEIDLSTFLTLSDHDLRELGISTFGARRKMLLAITDLNKQRNPTPITSVGPPTAPSPPSPRPPTPGSGTALVAGGNSASQLFPSPDPPTSSLISARGGPDLASLSGHW